MNLDFSSSPIHRGVLWGEPRAGPLEQLDEPARCAALEILARLIARMLVAAANEANHE